MVFFIFAKNKPLHKK